MAENEHRTIDPNAADVEVLSELPGIGPVTAQRIIDARPYERAEDLTKVQGIGPSTVARLQPRLAFDGSGGESEGAAIVEAKAPEVQGTYEVPPSAEEEARESPEFEQAEEEVGEAFPSTLEEVPELGTPLEPVLELPAGAEAAEPLAEPQAVLGAEVEGAEKAEEAVEVEAAEPVEGMPARPAKAEAQPARRGWVLWTVAGSALLVLILSLALNLGILASINGGRLLFASPAQLGEVRVRVDGLDARAAELGQEVQSLRARLDNVEAFGGRIDALEGSTEQLGAELEDTASKVQGLSAEVNDLGQELSGLGQDLAALDKEISGLQGEVQTLQEQTARTQSFFDGLRALLNELFVPEGGAK